MSIIHDYGTEEKIPIPLKIQTFSAERLSNISFLFGGVGDGMTRFPSFNFPSHRNFSLRQQPDMYLHLLSVFTEPSSSFPKQSRSRLKCT